MNKKSEDRRSRAARLRQISLLTTIPAALLAGPLIGFFGGRALDRWLGTEPWLLIVLSILGLAASGKEVYRLISLADEEERRE